MCGDRQLVSYRLVDFVSEEEKGAILDINTGWMNLFEFFFVPIDTR